MNLEQQWQTLRRINRLPDTNEARAVFYHGCRFAFEVCISDPSEDDLYALNDALQAFAHATIDREREHAGSPS